MSEWVSIAGGLVALTIGAELLIRGSTALARRMGVSELLIGLTLVGFGTSTPELVASVQAALVGSPGVAVGNVVGSNLANILLILGLSALIAPIAVERKSFNRDAAALALATLLDSSRQLLYISCSPSPRSARSPPRPKQGVMRRKQPPCPPARTRPSSMSYLWLRGSRCS
jgi:Ca2+/Na+ antiporter